jgi:hypothetical protein
VNVVVLITKMCLYGGGSHKNVLLKTIIFHNEVIFETVFDYSHGVIIATE